MEFRDGRPVSSPGNSGGKAGGNLRTRPSMPMDPSPETPPPSGTITTAMRDFADAWQALAEPTHAGMAMDPDMQREMVLATGTLATRADCTHVAVQDGDWTAASTWMNVSTREFGAPGAGAKVGIPSGITVTMDNNSTTAIDTARVDGVLSVATDQNTKLVYDTMIFHHGSEFIIGTSGSPLSDAYTCEFETADNGDIDTSVDDLLLGRGIVGMGEVAIFGAVKEPWYKMTTGLSAGATSLTLPVTDHGWKVGDEISIGATIHKGNVWNGTRVIWEPHPTEHVTITNVAGAVITFTPALTDARSIPAVTDMTDIGYYVGNFTRNVRFYSPSGTLRHRRGHIMFMHDSIDIRNAEFTLLGRTLKGGKSIAAEVDGEVAYSFPATSDAMRIGERGSDLPWLATSNVQGRYNLHLHRAGTGPGALTANIENCAASDSPGWLYAHHSSIADFKRCVGRRFNGVGLMSEVGDEVGTWSDCLMMTANRSLNNDYIDPEKKRIGTDSFSKYPGAVDLGRNGSGYWARSRVVQMERCVAQDVPTGFVWMARGNIASPRADRTPEPRVFYGNNENLVDIEADRPALFVTDCVCANVELGMLVIKSDPIQNHELRSHFLTNTFWNMRIAFHVEYTGNYSFTGNRSHGIPNTAIQRIAQQAFQAGNNTRNMVVKDMMVRGGHTYGAMIKMTDGGVSFGISADTVLAHKIIDMDATPGISGTGYPASITAIDPRIEDEQFYDDGVNPREDNFKVGTATDFDWPTTPTMTITTEPTLSLSDRLLSDYTLTGGDIYVNDGSIGGRPRRFGLSSSQTTQLMSLYGYWTYDSSNWLLIPDFIEGSIADSGTNELPRRYVTLVVRWTDGVSNYTNNGTLATAGQRYIDAILIGRGTPPGSPDANAGAWVVYEDIFGAGLPYEGL